MRLQLARLLFAALAVVAVTATLADAQPIAPGAIPGVRGASRDAVHLLEELVARSGTARDLVEQLGRSDLVIFIRYEWFQALTLRGRIGFLTSNARTRLVAIEVSSRQTRLAQLSSLGHELQHAAEIAGAASVHDARTLAALYTSIGEPSGYPGAETYETAAAIAVGDRVRQELVAPAHRADPAVSCR
jgi:hypothetical protein